ncbi:putative LRR receptor-like serine/threonine-protein kinase, partial [Cucurbita argyrosperma subsp. argyrosperma]
MQNKWIGTNLKAFNILLNADMEPLITDLGLNKLLSRSSKIAFASTSSRNFGSHRSTPNRDHHDGGGGGSPAVSMGSAYQAPESLKNLKPSPKWDVYSFGLILVELLSGKIVREREREREREGGVEDEGRMKKMVDPTIRGELEGKEEAVMEIFRLGFRCACFVPQKRPTMREAVQVLEKVCSS